MISKKNRGVAVFLMVLLFSACMTGCGKTQKNASLPKAGETKTAGKAEKTVRIGVLEPLSGALSKKAKDELTGIELAHDLYPTALQKKVDLMLFDNQSDEEEAKVQAQKLVEKRPAVVLGSYDDLLSLAASEVFEKEKIPTIAVTCTNPLITSSKDSFRINYEESFQGVAAAKYVAENLGVTKAAIMTESGDGYSKALGEAFREKFISLTKDEYAIISDTEYKAGDEDFKEQLKEIKKSGAKIVYLPAKAKDAANIMKAAKKLGLNLMFLGTNQWSDPELVSEGGDAVEGACFVTTPDVADVKNDMAQKFLSAYQEKYGKDAKPSSAAAMGFDSYILAIKSINQAGTALDGKAIQKALAKMKGYQGASGTITFDKNGDPIRSMSIKTIRQGNVVTKDMIEPTWS